MSKMNDTKDAGGNRDMSNPESPSASPYRHPNARQSNESGNPETGCLTQQSHRLEKTFVNEMPEGSPQRMFMAPVPPPGSQPNGVEWTRHPFSSAAGPRGQMGLPRSQQSWRTIYPPPKQVMGRPMFPVGHLEHDSFLMDPNFDIGFYGGGYGNNQSAIGSEEKAYHMQLLKHRGLPFDAHQKIKKMPGYAIVDYFEVSLFQLRNGEIVASTCNPKSFAVYTKKPETGQHWLIVFADKGHNGTVIKLNRLLTAHVNVNSSCTTTIEVQFPDSNQAHAEYTYLFNFEQDDSAQRFLDLMIAARRQIWSGELIDPKEVMRSEQKGSHFKARDFIRLALIPSAVEPSNEMEEEA